MTEQPPTSTEESVEPIEPASEEPPTTGVAEVDQVLLEVDDLAEVPLEEHLGRFERAHEALRSALDADPGDPGEPSDPA
jgi:hypothetical protein